MRGLSRSQGRECVAQEGGRGKEPLERELEEEGTPGCEWITPRGVLLGTSCYTRGLLVLLAAEPMSQT